MDKKEIKALKERFRQWGRSIEICEEKQAEIRRIRKVIDNIANGSEKMNKALENTIRIYNEDIERLYSEIENDAQERKRLGEEIGKLSPTEQKVLRLRYDKGYNWTGVAMKAYLSERQVFNVHNSALKKIIEQRY